MITQLILPEEVLSLAFLLDDPISPPLVRSTRIQIAQLRYIRPAFGDVMYKNMQSGNYDQFVVDYIKPALAHYVRYEMTGELAVRAGEYGVVRPSSEMSVQTSSAIKNDQQNKRDELDQKLYSIEDVEKRINDTNTKSSVTDSETTKSSNEFSDSQNVKLHTMRDNDGDQAQNSSVVIEETDVLNNIKMIESNSNDMSNMTRMYSENTTDNYKDLKDMNYIDSVLDMHSESGTDKSSVIEYSESHDTTIKNITGVTTLKSENSGVGNTNRMSFKAATTDEWQILARQSLRDANVFLRYAVEYVEANVDQFPDYAPMLRLASTITRRQCVGGIVL